MADGMREEFTIQDLALIFNQALHGLVHAFALLAITEINPAGRGAKFIPGE